MQQQTGMEVFVINAINAESIVNIRYPSFTYQMVGPLAWKSLKEFPASVC